MAGDPLGTLAKLARRKVDAERRALAALDERRRALLGRIEAAGRATAQETAAAGQLPAGAMLLSSYLAAQRERARILAAELEALDRQRPSQLERLTAKRLEARRLERLGERRRAAFEEAAARRETRVLDDLITTRAARREGR